MILEQSIEFLEKHTSQYDSRLFNLSRITGKIGIAYYDFTITLSVILRKCGKWNSKIVSRANKINFKCPFAQEITICCAAAT